MLVTEAAGHELEHKAGWSESGNSRITKLSGCCKHMLMQIIVTGCSRVLSLVCFIRY